MAARAPVLDELHPAMYSLLGGRRVLRPQIGKPNARQFAAAIREGLPASALEAFVEVADLPAAEVIEMLGMSRRTWARRKREGAALTAVESDRLYRLVRTVARAGEVLGSRDKGLRWMQKPNRALEGETPFSLLDTEVGERLVEAVLDRIEHGVFG